MKRTYGDTRLWHSQVRVGRGGQPITITKIRTMPRGAHRQYDTKKTSDPFHRDTSDDPRTGRFGRLIRKTRIDEFPQIWNFIKGDLRLMGFRPILHSEYRKLPPDMKKIYNEIGPGIVTILPLWKRGLAEEQKFEEYRKFHRLWKKSKAKAITRFLLSSFKRGPSKPVN